MLERIDYIVKNEKIWIYRCYGEGTIVEIPGELRGLPVVELADHCFAREASYRYKESEIQTIYREEWENPGMSSDPAAVHPEYPVFSSQIEEVYFPENLIAIEDYVFYGCPNLHILHIPTTMKRFSGQTFVATHHLKCFHFTVNSEMETPFMLKDFLWEIPDKLNVIFEDRQGNKLFEILYLDYYEESQENTPARIISIVYHGTGYKYRQCFNGKEIDFKKFDEQFHFAVAQEYMPNVFELAYTRLTYPRGFSEEAREEYLTWLRLEYKALSRWIFDEHKEDFIRTLGAYSYFNEDLLGWFLNMASDKKYADVVSYLMDYRRTHFGTKKKKKYEF